ncbi:MAG TPA: lasso peptide biosynthesis B2 protein [Alphaproteobacteria bacterium]|nr:lasso peptide biosynthesis B2 protein [Alphaproteobacteria bacterium]
MRAVRRFLRLPAAERRRTLEAAATLALVRALLAALPFARAMALLRLRGGAAPGPAGTDAAAARAVARAVDRAARHLPFRAVCLPRAVASALMLRRRGLPAEVHFGVAKDGALVEAHAWSVSGPVTVTGGAERPRFTPITVFRA